LGNQHVNTKAKAGVMQLQVGNVKIVGIPPGARKRSARILS
jgi:hypothetical protein